MCDRRNQPRRGPQNSFSWWSRVACCNPTPSLGLLCRPFSITPPQSLHASLDQPLAIVRFDQSEADRAGEPGSFRPHVSRAADERPEGRTLEPGCHGTFAAEAAVPGLVRVGPRLLDVLLDDLLSPAHHAAIVESVAIEQSKD